MSQTQYARWQTHKIIRALKSRRIIILAGARQSGKTTLVKQLANKNLLNNPTDYRTLDDVTLLEAALSDPHGFVTHQEGLMIIDEIQRAPILLQAIKQDVDLLPLLGRFLLTGSANIQSLPNVRESLAGRVRKIQLRPLVQGEIHFRKPRFMAHVFTESFFELEKSSSDEYNKDTYLSIACRGGYPEVLTLEGKEINQWHNDYIDALVERDLKNIANIRRLKSMHKLIEILAAWSSKFIDISAIGNHLSLARPTLETYINALEALFLIERVPPWLKTDYDRVGKHDKLLMTDTGLMASLLRWRPDEIRLNGERNGKLIETFVFNQLSALAEAQDDDYRIYHYRDREKREIDFLVENKHGDLLGIEIKAGSALSKDSFKHLNWFKNRMVKEEKFIGIIFYTGNRIASFGDSMWAIPIHLLWS